ncbi:MAG: MMPL family transporter [Gammaproteobacteria bacterium]
MNKSPARILALAWFVGTLLLAAYLVTSLKVVNDLGQFMPANVKQPQLRVLESELAHGPAATVLLLSIHGGGEAEALRLSKAMQLSLSRHPGVLDYIHNGEMQLDPDLLTSMQAYRYLLTEPDWSVTGLHAALLARLSDLRVGAGPLLGQYLLADPYLSLRTYIRNAAGNGGPPRKQGVWFKPKQGALLLAKVRGASLNLDRMQQAIQHLRHAFDSLHPAQGVELQIAGPGAMAVASRAAIQQTIKRLSWVMLALMIIIFWLAYRSLRLMFLAAVPLLSATLVGMSLTQLVFGQVHGIVIAFGVTLLGMCMDYPLHLFSHCRHQESAQATMQRIWPTLRLGGISSALAFLVLLGSGFTGLSQLALFSASGVLAALWVTRQLLPHWVKPTWIHPRYVKLKQGFSWRWQLTAVVLVLCIPLLAMFGPTPLWETQVDAISPIPQSARALDGRLRKAMGAANVSHLFVVQADRLEQVLEKTEQLSSQLQPLLRDKLVSRIEAVTRLLPSAATQRKRQAHIPPPQVLATRLAAAVRQTPFKADAFSSFLAAAEKARHLQPLTLDDLHKTPLYPLVRQGLIRTAGGWMSVIRIAGVKSDQALDSWLHAHPQLARHHIQTRKAVSELLTSYREAAAERILLAFALLVILVWFAIRQNRRRLRVLLPVLLSVMASLSMPLLLGHGLTVFHLLAALLVMGMGLDYSLFFNREQHLQGEHVQSMHAIGISMLTTVIAFSVLAISSIPVMAAMGTVIAAGILLCFLLAWLLTDPADQYEDVA